MSSLSELKEKYNSLDKRERKMLFLGVSVISLFMIYSLIYKPLNDSISKLEQSNVNNQNLLVWMRQAVSSIKSSPGNGKMNKRSGRSLNVIINTTASSSRISISRSQPRDNKQYQIWLDRVAFKDLLLWLNILQKDYGIFVSTINLSAIDSSIEKNNGQVRVTLTFQDSGS